MIWLLLLLLIGVQAWFTFNSMSQIRYEELAESVRNVFWLGSGYIYDGVSSNIGWYGILLWIYKLFGFDLFSAKIFRLVLQAISLVCVFLVLKKYLGVRYFWLPLLAWGLSPTMLYFNTMQTSYGIDLQYAPIVLALLIFSPLKPIWMGLIMQVGAWIIAMIAWMSYPTFMLYLPVFVLVHARLLRLKGIVKNPQLLLATAAVSVIGFLLPLLIGVLSVQNRELLWYDQNKNSGLFRGAGGEGLRLENFNANFSGMLNDLFGLPKSYYFEAEKGEFSDLYPLVGVIFVLGAGFVFKATPNFISRKTKTPTLVGDEADKNSSREARAERNRVPRVYAWKSIRFTALGLLAASMMLTSFTQDPSGAPGIRRYTPALAGFYVLFANVWYTTALQKWNKEWKKWVGYGILGMFVVHHIIVLPMNIASLSKPGDYREPLWFAVAAGPKESLASWVHKIRVEDLKLGCFDKNKQPMYCRYSEIFAAVAGSCVWNKIGCHDMYGYDLRTRQYIPLRIALWNEYYWEH